MARRSRNRRAPRGTLVDDGVLAGHYKQGKVFRTTLNAYEATRKNDWSRDDLPDLLWPLVLVHLRGDLGAARLGNAQSLLLDHIDEEFARSWPVALDGRLTSLELFPSHVRDVLVAELRESSLGQELFPPELLGVMRLYPDCPGTWLFADDWSTGDLPTEEESATLLGAAIVSVLSDRHANALVKVGVLTWQLQVGTIHWPQEMLDDLADWPDNPETRSRGDATILSSFLATKALNDANAEALDWARDFWAENWRASPCLLGDVDDVPEADAAQAGKTEGNPEAQGEDGPSKSAESEPDNPDRPTQLEVLVENLLDRLWDEYRAFLELALDPELAVNLWQPARHEVTCGLVTWVYRSLLKTLSYPAQWSGEHSALAMRQVVEVKVALAWMDRAGDDAFDRYQAYGAGKQKLTLSHAKALSEDFEDEVPEILAQLIANLDQKVGGMTGEFTDVSIEGSFSGKSLRAMAEEVGSLDEWRHVYQPASGVIHGEWGAIEEYAMERCMNPLHRFHAVPGRNPTTRPTLEFGEFCVHQFRRLTACAREVLGPKPEPTENDHE